MRAQNQYLRNLLASPELRAQLARRSARVGDGMRRLRWALIDSLQIGVAAAYALLPMDHAPLNWASIVALLPLGLVATITASLIRRSFQTNVFAKETTYALVRRGAVGAFMTFVAIAAFASPWADDPGLELSRIAVIGVISTGVSIALTLVLARWSAVSGNGTAAVAVIGDVESADKVTAALNAGRWPGWIANMQLDVNSAGEIEALRAKVAGGEIDVVIIAAGSASEKVRHIVAAMPDATARICVALDVPQQRAEDTVIWLVDLWRNPHDGVAGALKRVMDLILSCFGLLFIAPALLLVALAIKLDSPGPVLFRQWRFGACSRPFEVLKFRSMQADRADESGAQRTLANDDRVTRIGRLIRRSSIDELPQLINVVRGEMSLVGPRAQALFMEVDGSLMFEALGDYPARHRVLPGITGWAQVNGSRGEVDTLEKATRRTELDLWYIKNWSLWLDIRILLRTVFGGFTTFYAD